ncbi:MULTISPECIES: SDR family oxidoreductase [unclassified Streptomyces]|uniref:SDR family NAD(P)-dependent oxidoreductase n=1 Tax=unclassified Streptomyces TaxID=2593676 RepID=UPI0022771D63|nr:SDR family oxidoreductase [Streptomyces sp. BoleA5]
MPAKRSGSPSTSPSKPFRIRHRSNRGSATSRWTRAASRVLRADGRIITVSSGLGSRVGLPGLADYAATKSGIERYTMGVARDLGPRGITANVVEAGLMKSGMEPPDPETLKALVSSLSLQRMGRPEEIAAAIAFLASPAASYVTGAVLDAHGGYNA